MSEEDCCIADELKPDRNAIEEDMMQDVDKNEGDDHSTKNDPRSAMALATDYKNDKTLDDERVQTRSKESSRVVTLTVTGKTDCEECDRGQRRSTHQPDAISNMDGEGEKQSKYQSEKIAKDR